MNLSWQTIHVNAVTVNILHLVPEEYVAGSKTRTTTIHTQHKKVSNHHANLPLEMYSFTL